MKAAVLTRYGPPNVVQIAEVDKPAPREDELLVRVHATTVNRTDCGIRIGTPFLIRLFYGLRGPRVSVNPKRLARVPDSPRWSLLVPRNL